MKESIYSRWDRRGEESVSNTTSHKALLRDTHLYEEMRVDSFLKFIGQARNLHGETLKEGFDRSWQNYVVYKMLFINELASALRRISSEDWISNRAYP